jgi:hypothetical protein
MYSAKIPHDNGVNGYRYLFEWFTEHQHAFENVKHIICREVMLSYPDFSKPFHIYTDTSDDDIH